MTKDEIVKHCQMEGIPQSPIYSIIKRENGLLSSRTGAQSKLNKEIQDKLKKMVHVPKPKPTKNFWVLGFGFCGFGFWVGFRFCGFRFWVGFRFGFVVLGFGSVFDLWFSVLGQFWVLGFGSVFGLLLGFG